VIDRLPISNAGSLFANEKNTIRPELLIQYKEINNAEESERDYYEVPEVRHKPSHQVVSRDGVDDVLGDGWEYYRVNRSDGRRLESTGAGVLAIDGLTPFTLYQVSSRIVCLDL
jgi:hypothetical protein